MKLKYSLPNHFLDAESRELIVSEQTKKLWAVELDLLLEFDRVCKKHNIKYSLFGGSLLGAARHHGMIPWDNDIDVAMMRSEYIKLCHIAPNEFLHPYFFQTNQTEPGTLRGHAQLRNSDTTGILKLEMSKGHPVFSFNQGIFIDIFPMDRIPDNDDEASAFLIRLEELRMKPLVVRSRTLSALHYQGIGDLIKNVVAKFKGAWYLIEKKLFNFDRATKLNDEYELACQKYNGTDAKRCSLVSFRPLWALRVKMECAWFDKLIDADFEGYKLPIPADYDAVLRREYGNWHEHAIGGSMHGDLLVDVDKSYTHYLNAK